MALNIAMPSNKGTSPFNPAAVVAVTVGLAVDQSPGRGFQADGGLDLVKAQLVVGEGVAGIEGDGKGGMEADAEGQIFLVPVFHSQGVMEYIALNGEGGHQPELPGPDGQGFGGIGDLQNQGILVLIDELVFHGTGEAVLGAGSDFLTLGDHLAVL